MSSATGASPSELQQLDPRAVAREQAEAVLRETAQFYIALDEAGVVRSWNRAASRIFGFQPGQALGRPLHELIIPPTHRRAHVEGIAGFVRTGRGRGVDAPVIVRAMRADGSAVPVELTIWAQRTPEGYLFHALGSDLTERQAHEHVVRVLAEHRRALLHLEQPADVQRLLVDTVLRATGCDGAWLYVPEGGSPLRSRLTASAVSATTPDLALLEQPPAAPDVRTCLPEPGRRLSRQEADAAQAELRDRLPSSLRTVAVEPVLMGDEVAGLLAVGWQHRRDPLPGATQELLALLAAEAGLVIQRLDLQARLAAAAHTDSLTGLANRRAFDETLTRELSRAAREDGELTLVLVDLDHFKTYNDTYGHPAGDELLRATSAAWSRAVREPDLLARLGGDEFALILPGTSETAAEAAVARLVAITPRGTPFSTGAAARRPGDDSDSLLQRADQALYRRKRDRR